MSASVKVGRVPGRITEVNVVEGETTIAEVLSIADLSVEDGFSIRLNGDNADVDEVVEDGDSVTLVKDVKGNQSSVKVGKVPGRITEVNVIEGETTISEVLSLADLSVEDGFSIRLNGDNADVDEVVEDGDSVTLVKDVKGN